MSKAKIINYVDLICGLSNDESESFGGIFSNINESGYACVDYGYVVRLEHIVNIRLADMKSLEDVNTLD